MNDERPLAIPEAARRRPVRSSAAIPSAFVEGEQPSRGGGAPGGEPEQPSRGGAPGASTGRTLARLAIPTLGALIAEPLFVLIDSAIVGHLGTAELAGLSLASTVLLTAVGLLIFLAYATTAQVARLLGAGHPRTAFSRGIDGIWLAVWLGLALIAVGYPLAPTVLGWFNPSPAVLNQAVIYLRWSLPGLPGMLVVLAATGVLRGLQDTRTPLIVAGAGAAVNAGLNALLVYGAGLGIAGSAIGTATTQTAMAIVLAGTVIAAGRRHSAPLRPHLHGVLTAARSGVPLFVRSLTLRIAIIMTTAIATGLGAVALGAHQVVNSIWGFAGYALDALAIAAQTVIGQARGRLAEERESAPERGATAVSALGGVGRDAGADSDAGADQGVSQLRRTVRASTRWSLAVGTILGALLLALAPVVPALFTTDPAVRTSATAALIVCALAMPLASYVFLLDGVLIGAEQGRYLAAAGVVTLAAYGVALLATSWLGDAFAHGGAPPWLPLALLWVAFAFGYLGARALANGLRIRTMRW